MDETAPIPFRATSDAAFVCSRGKGNDAANDLSVRHSLPGSFEPPLSGGAITGWINRAGGSIVTGPEPW